MATCSIRKCSSYGAKRGRGLCLHHFDRLHGDEEEERAGSPWLTPAELARVKSEVEVAAAPLFVAAMFHLIGERLTRA